MTENDQTGSGLGGAFGKTKTSGIGYGHPYGKEIIDSAKEIIKTTPTGKMLLRSCEMGKIPINVIKGLGEPGFSAESRIIYIQAAGNALKADPKLVLQIVKALREADQDMMGLKAPDPSKDIMAYASVIHAKNMDSIVHVCKFVKDLINTSLFTDFLDTLGELGYKKVYQVYSENGSDEEIFKAYANS